MMTMIVYTRGQEVKHYSHVSRSKISIIGGLPGTVRGSYDRYVTLVPVVSRLAPPPETWLQHAQHQSCVQEWCFAAAQVVRMLLRSLSAATAHR